MSKQPSKNRASEEAYYREWKRIDKVFKDPYLGLFKPISLYKLLRKIDKELGEIHSFHKKIDSTMAACWSKSRSIPENVTIREEYVKCKKPNCRRKQHGPYYYAYWKDYETKKLRKKYIGRHYFTPDEPKPEELAKNMVAQLPFWIFDHFLSNRRREV